MGIRESLKQLDEKDLKMQNFTMPEDKPEQDFEFDVEKEITPRGIKEINEKLQKYERQKKWDALINLAGLARIVMPEQFKIFNLQEHSAEIVNEIDEELKEYMTKSFIRKAIEIKFFMPEKITQEILEQKWPSIKYEVQPMSNRDNFSTFFDVKLLYPERTESFERDQIPLEMIIKSSRQEKDWRNFAGYLAIYKVLFPEKFSADNISKEEWQNMRSLKDKFKNQKDIVLSSKWEFFLRHLLNMKILAAKEVKITDEGIDFVMPEKKSFQPEKHKRPERRNF